MILTLAAAVVAAGQSFTCTPTHVWDGDGPIWCAEGPHIRISGIAAREMDGTCRTNQPCPPATALQARDRLVSLFGGFASWLVLGESLLDIRYILALILVSTGILLVTLLRPKPPASAAA